jgi:hypothetical protein
MKTIHGAPMFGRRNWTTTDMLLSVRAADDREVDAVSERGKRMLAQMAQRIIAVMKDNGWDGMWVQGVFDEPEDPFVDRYRELVSVLRGLKPDIKILEATMTTNVSGLVDIWCPQVQEYQANREFFDKRKAAGDKVWVYTCLSPGGPWLNRLLDEERLRQVYIGWALAKYDLQGYLHWGGTSTPRSHLKSSSGHTSRGNTFRRATRISSIHCLMDRSQATDSRRTGSDWKTTSSSLS